MRVALIVIAFIAAIALTAAAAAARALSQDAPRAPEDLAAHITIALPPGADGPVPALVMFSGCGGVRQTQADYAQTANAEGWAAVTVDSHGARGIGALGARLGVCTALRLRGAVRAADVFESLELVRADPRLDSERLALVGWSHGGWTILDAMALSEAGDAPGLDGVEAALLIYPYCGFLTRADTAPIGAEFPVTMVLAGRDRVVSAQACRTLADARGAEGAAIQVIEEPDLTHAFDAPDQPADPRMRYDAAGAERTRARLAQILAAADPG